RPAGCRRRCACGPSWRGASHGAASQGRCDVELGPVHRAILRGQGGAPVDDGALRCAADVRAPCARRSRTMTHAVRLGRPEALETTMKSFMGSLGLNGQLTLGFGVSIGSLAALTLLAAWQTSGAARDTLCFAGGALIVMALAQALWIAAGIGSALAQSTALAQQLANGQLTDDASAPEHGPCAPLNHALQALRTRLSTTLGQVHRGMTAVAATSSKMSRDNSALVTRTREQSASLQQTAAALAE